MCEGVLIIPPQYKCSNKKAQRGYDCHINPIPPPKKTSLKDQAIYITYINLLIRPSCITTTCQSLNLGILTVV